MKMKVSNAAVLGLLLTALGSPVFAQPAGGPPPGDNFRGPGGPGGGFGGMRQKSKLVEKFDKNGDGVLDTGERKEAREFLSKQPAGGRGPRPGGPGGRFGGEEAPATPGKTLTPAEVQNFSTPLYDPKTLRTFFVEFESKDWEKELSAFKNTDVEVLAKVTVDGKTYSNVGVRFRGNSSFMMVSEGRKKSLAFSFDLVNKDQNLLGYRNIHLLNSHEDPSFLRTVLSLQMARDYMPAPKANLARVVLNGENWGIYVNTQPFDKEFVKEAFGTTKGARWKVPGSPGSKGSLAYVGENLSDYKRTYQLKTKEDKKDWAALMKLCKVLNETPPEQLEKELAPLLDSDSVLKYLAWDNVLMNGDGYWVRTSDYDMYQDKKGQFHVIPHDANETFWKPGGGPGGPGGRRGGPGTMLGNEMLEQGDEDGDRKLSQKEFSGVVENWFGKLDKSGTGKLSQEILTANLPKILPQGPGPGGPRGPGGPGGFGPATFLAPALFNALDSDKDMVVTKSEWAAGFAKWFKAWDKEQKGHLDEETLRSSFASVLGQGGPGGPGGPGMGGGRGGGFGGPGGPGMNMPRINGVELSPLFAEKDVTKPLLSKLLAVPALKAKYLSYVKEMSDKWLAWEKLGPIAQQYHDLIAKDVGDDNRKLESTSAFENSLLNSKGGSPGRGRESITIKDFADQRRAYLSKFAETASQK